MALAPNLPFNSRELQDGYYNVGTGSTATQAPSYDLVQATPYPVTERINVYVYAKQTGATATSSVYLQESADNVTFANIAAFAAPLVTQMGTGTGSATVKLEPNALRYLRVSGSGATSTYGAILKF